MAAIVMAPAQPIAPVGRSYGGYRSRHADGRHAVVGAAHGRDRDGARPTQSRPWGAPTGVRAIRFVPSPHASVCMGRGLG